MKKIGIIVVALFIVTVSNIEILKGQTRQVPSSQQFVLGERIIRIAEPGMLADSVNVWGDVGSSGRYLVPQGTNLAKLLSYSFGPRTLSNGQTQIDWSKMRVEVNIQEYDVKNGDQIITKFEYKFEEPFPTGMREFELENNQTIAIRVKRKPSFRDYLSVFASTISAVASTVLLLEALRGN